MINETYYINELKKHEYNFKRFMGIETFPQYTICSKEASVLAADSQGYESIARSHFDVKNNTHTLTISTNCELCEYIMFHEFTHMLDSENYVKNDPTRYIGLSGFTEYHASQIELMALLCLSSIKNKPSFSMNQIIYTISGEKSVKQYISEKQQHAIELFSRDDFPSSIETLNASFGVLYNYWGLRSICKMYAADYKEDIQNQSFLKYIPTSVFVLQNGIMRGWLNDSTIDKSIALYARTIYSLIQQYKLH